MPADQVAEAPFLVHAARGVRRPLVVACPHAGRDYPKTFLNQAQLPLATLRRAEDAHIDRLCAGLPDHGMPLIEVKVPRAYLDVNRSVDELDPRMFTDPPDRPGLGRSRRVDFGLGLVPRRVGEGADIYPASLPWAEAEARIAAVYRPYHTALAGLLEDTHKVFGGVLLIDCHSMPAHVARSREGERIDAVLGNRHNQSCAPGIMHAAMESLRHAGLKVASNHPYAGGYTTSLHGHPETGRHALQVEFSRALYMDEATLRADDAALARLGRTLIGMAEASAAALSGLLSAAGADRGIPPTALVAE